MISCPCSSADRARGYGPRCRRCNSFQGRSFIGRARWPRHDLQSRRDRVRFPGVLLQLLCCMRDRALPHRGESQEVHLPFRRVSWCEPMVRRQISRGPGLANGERGEEAKAELGASPGDHAFAPSRANDRFICGTSTVRYRPVRRQTSGCSSGVERVVRDHEVAGAIPATPTKRCPHSSVEERLSYTQGAGGANPSAGTKHPPVAQ